MGEICGKWRVKMRGWWWLWFRNIKYILQNTDGSIQGHNVLWGWLKWGDFWVQKQGDKPQYGFFYKHFTDGVYLHDENEASGVLSTKPTRKRKPVKVLASFTMTRILPKAKDE